jgi:hypothetical protein
LERLTAIIAAVFLRPWRLRMTQSRKTTPRTPKGRAGPTVPALTADRLVADVRALIEAARERTARAFSAVTANLYWQLGTRIRGDSLREKRAGYGEEIVAALSRQLTAEFGRGYTEKSRC